MDETTALTIKKLADEFIAMANERIDDHSREEVSKALMFATARFSAYLVASMSDDMDDFQRDAETGLTFFTNEFREMFVQNLADYEPKFVDTMKYGHLTKKAQENPER
ncbi:MAG: DUF3144 domain-containing protein [bacterium]